MRLSASRHPASVPVPVLLYHSVSDDPPAWIRPFSVTPETFRRQLELIRESGATALRVSEYVAALSGTVALPERTVLITFDDGLADFRDQALPALDRVGLPATLYVTSGFLEGSTLPPRASRPAGPWLDAASLTELHALGVEIGAHSHTHPHLDTLSTVAAHDELARPKELLEEAVGAPVSSFAYPHGYTSRSLRRLARECGYTSACAVKNAFSSGADDPFALARLTLRADTSIAELAAWLEGRGARVPPHRERAQTRAWRAYRRGRTLIQGRPGSDWA
jgi:peptidoglycan/xylan/chitin deacetylase (PgdA/CDA1 family)